MTGPAGVTVNYTSMDQLLKRMNDFASVVEE